MPHIVPMPKIRTKRFKGKKASIAERKALLKDFPVGSEISYKNNDDSFGKVIEYDLHLGRLITDQGGSFDPTVMKVLVKPGSQKARARHPARSLLCDPTGNRTPI